jgi:riboflavin kinase/FMN adenylyltransferase
MIEREFSPKIFLCGDDFRFGFQAQGTPEILKASTQVCVEVVKLLKINEEKISSSAIKSLLKNGDIEQANLFLGEDFFLKGEVVKDRQVGRTLGFPTANIIYPKDKFPIKQGVYQTWSEIDGKLYHGVTNFGSRPTFHNDDVVAETHFIGFDGDLYGKTLTVHFTRHLRDVQKFDNIAQLKIQLAKDIQMVQKDEDRTN